MDERRLGAAVRARRHARGWRLVDLAAAAGTGATSCSLLERGRADRLTVRLARAIAAAVDLPLEWDIGWRRQDVDRLLDADHAALGARLARRLARDGWVARAEVSFNRYGDRGRIDLLAFHPDTSTLLVVEVKTAIVDAQELLGGLDVKRRVAPSLARELGWAVTRTVPAIVVLAGTTARRRLTQLAPLFAAYSTRGRAALAWMRAPTSSASGLLVLAALPPNAGSDVRRAGRRRVRKRAADPRSGIGTPGVRQRRTAP
jgi:transcriptional regulator with XRE-family HTH domain